jgi:uncharacterized YccA/Bax inhibitor family protein
MSKQNIKKFAKEALIVMGLIVVGLTAFQFIPAFAAESITDVAPGRIDEWTGGATGLRGLVLTIVNYLLGFLGLIAVLMIIYGGMLYVTAAGAQEKVDKGKKILMYTIIGIIIIILSFVIVNAVLGAGTGTET